MPSIGRSPGDPADRSRDLTERLIFVDAVLPSELHVPAGEVGGERRALTLAGVGDVTCHAKECCSPLVFWDRVSQCRDAGDPGEGGPETNEDVVAG